MENLSEVIPRLGAETAGTSVRSQMPQTQALKILTGTDSSAGEAPSTVVAAAAEALEECQTGRCEAAAHCFPQIF